ncbi:MAG: hypothetical protein R3266_15160, partial [Gemmatimonadota bacterium]|nr:hypothetical protein [Gemmatimonadota bacterium]
MGSRDGLTRMAMFLAWGVGACDVAEPTDACRTDLSPDAWVGTEPPAFVELWRAGGTNEGEELAAPFTAAASPNGALAIPDVQLGLVGVGPDGAWIGSLVPRGGGPGEVELPLAAAWTDEGHLLVLDFEDGTVLELATADALESTRRPEWTVVSGSRLHGGPLAAAVRGGQLAAIGLSPAGFALLQDNVADGEADSVTQTLLRLPANGAPADTVASVRTPSLGGEWRPARNLPAAGAARLLFAAGPGGRIAYAGGEQAYAITVEVPGSGVRELCRAVPPLPLRSDERGEPAGDPDPENPFLEAVRNAGPVEPPA